MRESDPSTIVGLTNSLRGDSYNWLTMRTVARLMEPRMRLAPFDISAIPFFEPDIDPAHAPLWTDLYRLEAALHSAAGVLIAVPEYNHSIPGRLKNALDMVSRIVSQPMDGMPVLIVSASIGRLGGARAQYELRRVLDSMGALSLIRPEVFIGEARAKFNAEGECIDSTTLSLLQAQIEAFSQLLGSARIDRRLRNERR